MQDFQPPTASTPPPACECARWSGWNRQRLLLVGVCLALLAAVATGIDIAIATWARDVGLRGDLKRLIRLAEVFGFGVSVGLIILTAAILDGRCWRVGLRLAASSLGAGLVADGIKLLVARQRPGFVALDSASALDTFSAWLPLLHRESLPSAYGYAWQSFPSAHCATAAGLAVGLALLYPRGRWLFALFAALACWQRIDAQAHFLSDCLAGAAVGCFIAAFAARLPCREQETTEDNSV